MQGESRLLRSGFINCLPGFVTIPSRILNPPYTWDDERRKRHYSSSAVDTSVRGGKQALIRGTPRIYKMRWSCGIRRRPSLMLKLSINPISEAAANFTAAVSVVNSRASCNT